MRAALVITFVLCACSGDVDGQGGPGTPATPVSIDALYGLWLHRDAEGVDRVMSFARRDDYNALAAGRVDVSAICIDGERVQTSTFSVAEGHIVQEVLEDADRANVGTRFGTEVFAFDGDTMALESASDPSGRRTWTKVDHYTPRAATGWLVARAPPFADISLPYGSTDIAWDADGDWHIVASEQRTGSIPGGGSGTRYALGVYGTRKNNCDVRTYEMPATAWSSLAIHDGTLYAWINRLDDYITLGTRAVGDNLTGLVSFQEEPIDGLAAALPGSFGVDADGTQHVVRRDGTKGGVALWRRKPGAAWTSTPLPEEPVGKVVYDRDGRLHYVSAASRLFSEAADGTFSVEEVIGADSGGASAAELAIAPDGSLHVVSGSRGIEVFTKDAGVWSSTRLTRTPTPVAFEIDSDGMHHFWSRTGDGTQAGGKLTYVRWDGAHVTFELPGLAEVALTHDRPFVRLGPDGQVALGVGAGFVAIRPADADAFRKSVQLTLTLDGEGSVALDGQAPCTETCVVTLPAGSFTRVTVEPASGWAWPRREDFLEEDGDTGLVRVGVTDQELKVTFTRSNVQRVVYPEPPGVTLQMVDAGSGGAVAVASSPVAWTRGASSLEAGRFFGALDDDGAWVWARALPSEVAVTALQRMPGGDLALLGTFATTIDLGSGPLTATMGQRDGLVAHFAADGSPLFVRHLAAMVPFALTALGDSVVIAAQVQSAIDLDGRSFDSGAELLVRFARDGGVLATGAIARTENAGIGASHQVTLAASSDRLFVAGPAFGLAGATIEGASDRLAAYGPDLELLWSRVTGTPGLDHIAVDPDGRLHGYGPTRGGDYGGGEIPVPQHPTHSPFVHVIFAADGTYVSALAQLGYNNDIRSLEATRGALYFTLPPRPDVIRIGDDGQQSSILLLSTEPPLAAGGATSVGGVWLGDRYRLFANQTGWASWTITSGEHEGAVIVDGRF